MIFDGFTHNQLMERYRALPPEMRSVLVLSAMIYEPVTEIMLYQVIQKLPKLFPNITSFAMLPPILRRLLKDRLLDLNFQCQPDIVESVTREGASGKIFPEPGFEEISRILAEIFSESDSFSAEDPLTIHLRIMRDFRIALYTSQVQRCMDLYPRVLSVAAETGTITNPFLEVCCRPFDPDWFALLPVEIRLKTVYYGLSSNIFFLEPTPGLLPYACHPDFIRSVPQPEQTHFQVFLLSRLLVDLRLDLVKNLMNQWKNFPFDSLIHGMIFFLEGKPDEAVRSFHQGMSHFATEIGEKHFITDSIGGLSYILALLTCSEVENRDRLETILQNGLSEPHLPVMASSFRAIQAILRLQQYDTNDRSPVSAFTCDTLLGIDILFWAIASYRQKGQIQDTLLERLEYLFQKTREAELSWIAMECADLLFRTDRSGRDKIPFLNKIQSESGIRPVLVDLLGRDDWKKRLSALTHILNTHHPSGTAPGSTRLVWMVRIGKDHLSIHPKEQKILSTGDWSIGKTIPPNRLMTQKPEGVTAQDLRICAAIRSIQNPFQANSYEFDMDLALPALVGHPLVFLDENPPVPIEMIHGEPEAWVHVEKDRITLRMDPVNSKGKAQILQDSPTRFRVIRLTRDQQRIAEIITENGLTVPITSTPEILAAQAGISRHMTVHSNLPGNTDEAQDPVPDSRICIQIRPAGNGFRVNAVFRPFGSEGPTVTPGTGPETLIRQINGKCRQLQRNLKKELYEIHSLMQQVEILTNQTHRNFQWKLQDPEECLNLLDRLHQLQEEGTVAVEWPEGHRMQITREYSLSDCRLKITSRQNWFELTGQIAIDEQQILDISDLLQRVSENPQTRFIPVGNGLFLTLSRQLAEMLCDLAEFSDRHQGRTRIHPLLLTSWIDRLPDTVSLESDTSVQLRIGRIRKGLDLNPMVPDTFQASLRDYQVEGYRWLSRMAFWGLGACLADDMGLGKTIQVLAVLLSRSSGGPALVVAPASVCQGWLEEATRFAPSLRTVFLGTKNREETVHNLAAGDILITSYGLLSLESDLLSRIHWNTIVLDEAQVIKNISAKRSRSAMKLKADFRILTTGTPIENHPGEIFTLFRFLNPGLLGSALHFRSRFSLSGGNALSEESLLRLKKIIQPFVLRRMKSQVLTELPPKTEVVWTVDLSEKEMSFYEYLRQESVKRIENRQAGEGLMPFQILAEITRLRMACCDTRLVASESRIPSSKLAALETLVSDLLENRHRVLIFSQFVSYLKRIRSLFERENITYRYLDGSLPLRDRKVEIDRFQQGEGDVFLISLKAGGLGLNLTGADYVVLMDPWWNPAVEDQASDRAHRMGQIHPVTIYRLIARNTIEEKIIQLHSRKRNLAKNLLAANHPGDTLSVGELLELIQHEQKS
jgi:hypothetical protein